MPRVKSRVNYKNSTVKVDLNFPTQAVLTGPNVVIVGQVLRSMVLDFMSKGISPVTGRKFTAYKNPDNYPRKIAKKYPGKQVTPVNLKLNGNLWDSIEYKSGRNGSVVFGIFSPEAFGVGDYVLVHNEGTRPDIAQRKFLPSSEGEIFNRQIMLELKRRIVNIIKLITRAR